MKKLFLAVLSICVLSSCTPEPVKYTYQVVFAKTAKDFSDLAELGCEIESARWANADGVFGAWGYELIVKCPVVVKAQGSNGSI